MDKVELFLNGQSLGIKELKKDQHLAWNVKYVPGVIEARGYKDGKLALTARRETTGSPAALVVTPDRKQIAADGEDVAMFAVEVRDAQGRLVPVTSNNVMFKISGSGRSTGRTFPRNDAGLPQPPRQPANGPKLPRSWPCALHQGQVLGNADGNADSPGLMVHEIPVAMPTSRYSSLDECN